MDLKKKIVVLEDSPERIDQLKKWFPNEEIAWYTNVKSFLEETWPIQADLVKLIIFDHDLGSFKYEQGEIQEDGLLAYDPDGKSGHDAARELEASIYCPVLVWSYNTQGAKNIAQALLKNLAGASKIYVAPFSKDYAYKKYIMEIVG